MKSIKPGRGPSMMSGIGSIFVALFGVFWTLTAVNIGGGFMAIFGIIFIAMAVTQAVYNFKNATGENRYSAYDIVDEQEEIDPLNERFGKQDNYRDFEENSNDRNGYGADVFDNADDRRSSGKSRFCPYCGTPVEGDYTYCNKCGKKLP